MRRVYLVTGPPCAGKSTYVQRNRQPGDLVADFDEIARNLGPEAIWEHTSATAVLANREMDRLIATAAKMTAGTAWIIRCIPVAEDRYQLARTLKADRTIVLLPTPHILAQRARQRPRHPQTQQAIDQWRQQYTPWHGDQIVRT